MKIKVESSMLVSPTRRVQIQLTSGGAWVDFGYMNYEERKEFANQLRAMANELMKTERER